MLQVANSVAFGGGIFIILALGAGFRSELRPQPIQGPPEADLRNARLAASVAVLAFALSCGAAILALLDGDTWRA
jgi:hypothetical protein